MGACEDTGTWPIGYLTNSLCPAHTGLWAKESIWLPGLSDSLSPSSVAVISPALTVITKEQPRSLI